MLFDSNGIGSSRAARFVAPICCLSACTAAFAQDQGSGRVVEEVVVTAQKRQERLQDVPIAISVLNGSTLDRSADRGVVEAVNRIPGVSSLTTSTSARSNYVGAVVIRGVVPATGSSSTAYYLDSVPFAFVKRQIVPDASAYDLERVEVLRGPQGTLYGLGALNGVVRILTKDADLDDLEFKTRLSTGTTVDGGESYRGDAVVNVPIVEGKLAARAVVGYQELGGWVDKPIRKDANDAELGNYRLKVNAQPTEDLSLSAFAWLSRSEFGGGPSSQDGRHSQSLFEEPSEIDYDAFGFKAAYDFSSFTLSSMTSYIDFQSLAAVDFAPFSGPNVFLNQINAAEVFSQEVVLNSTTDGVWRWTVGGIYRDAKDKLWQTRNDPRTGALTSGYLAPTDQRTFSESFAVFGEITRVLFDGKFEVTGGLRYFEDDTRDQELSRLGYVGGRPPAGTINPATGLPVTLVDTSNKFDDVSPRVVLNWHPTEQATIYATYSQGFRSGLNQLPAVIERAPEFGPAKPDELSNYELGAKVSLWDGRVALDSAVFYIDWQDLHQTLSVLILPGVPMGAIVNAGSASGAGVDFGVTVEAMDGLTFAANVGWNDLTLDDDVIPARGAVVFKKGARLDGSAEYTAGVSADYGFPLGGSGLSARISTSANYLPEFITARNDTTQFKTESIWMARASFAVESDSWSTGLYVENATNEDGVVSRDQFSRQWDVRPRPRTVGIQFEYKY